MQHTVLVGGFQRIQIKNSSQIGSFPQRIGGEKENIKIKPPPYLEALPQHLQQVEIVKVNPQMDGPHPTPTRHICAPAT